MELKWKEHNSHISFGSSATVKAFKYIPFHVLQFHTDTDVYIFFRHA